MLIDKVKKYSYFKEAYVKSDSLFVYDNEKDKILKNIDIDAKHYRKSFLTYLGYLYKYSTVLEFERCVLKIYHQNYDDYEDGFLSRYGLELGRKKLLETRKRLSESQIGIDKLDRVPNCVAYWIKRGYNEDEAKIEISKRQSVLSKRKHNKYKKDKKVNHYREDNPVCIEYWLKRFGEEEAKEKHKYWQKNKHNFSSVYLKSSLGDKYDDFMEEMKIKRKAGLITAGYSYTSKASLKFFINVYRYIRKNIK